MHTHLHIAPRFRGDGQRVRFMRADPERVIKKYLDEIALRISSNI